MNNTKYYFNDAESYFDFLEKNPCASGTRLCHHPWSFGQTDDGRYYLEAMNNITISVAIGGKHAITMGFHTPAMQESEKIREFVGEVEDNLSYLGYRGKIADYTVNTVNADDCEDFTLYHLVIPVDSGDSGNSGKYPWMSAENGNLLGSLDEVIRETGLNEHWEFNPKGW